MFKVTKAEFKKYLSKPGVYILSIILAIILILGVFIYQPKLYEDTNLSLHGHTYVDKYTAFKGASGADKKSEIDSTLQDTIHAVKDYRIGDSNAKGIIDQYLTEFNSAVENYRDCGPDNTTQEDIDKIYQPTVVKKLDALDGAIDSAMLRSSKGSYVILSTDANYKSYKSVYNEIRSHFDQKINKSKILKHCNDYDTKYRSELKSTMRNFIYPNISEATIQDYTLSKDGSSLNTLYLRLSVILEDIEANYQIALNDSKKNTQLAPKMDQLANQYINTIKTYTNMVKYDLLSNALSYTTVTEEPDLMYINSYAEFNTNSLYARYTYLFENNKTENDYAHPLTIGVTSNHSTNAYDYAYFVLRLFSFVIIIYASMMACGAIAGEVKDGSMRYYAIRPISRSEIFFGKFFSIVTISTILLIFSSIIATLVGGVVYSFDSLNILTIFNGSIPMTIHPIGMLSIFLLSTLLEIIVYTAIAMLLSCVLKSDLFAVTIMIVLYLINILLPMFVSGANTWLAFYPFSHINLYALFGSSIYAVPNNFFNMILGAKVYMTTNVGLTVSMIIIFIIISSIIALRKFKTKEL